MKRDFVVDLLSRGVPRIDQELQGAKFDGPLSAQAAAFDGALKPGPMFRQSQKLVQILDADVQMESQRGALGLSLFQPSHELRGAKSNEHGQHFAETDYR